MDAAQAMPGSYAEPEEPLPLDQIAVSQDDIRLRRRDLAFRARVLRLAIVIGTLSVALCVGSIAGFQFLVFAPAPTILKPYKPNCSDRSGEAYCIAPKSDREAILSAPNPQKIALPAVMASGNGREPSHSIAQQATGSINAATLATQQKATLPAPRPLSTQHERSLPKLTPVPETRPSTIEGWRVRDVVGGTATLEGPNGILKATSGDTVPGLGRVDSIVRWGSGWIVATSRGLVSMP
jgi:hypothetical protein